MLSAVIPQTDPTGTLSGRVLIAGTASLFMCLFLSPRFITFVRRREFGQNIREELPEGHQARAGTPTLGGIVILVAFAVPFLILSDHDWESMGVFGVAVACALVGFTDDYMKIVRKRSLGLRGRWKLIATVAISVGLWAAAKYGAHLPSTVRLRFIDGEIDLGAAYPIFIYLVVAGTTSAVNLTTAWMGWPRGVQPSSSWPTSRSISSTGPRTWLCSPAAWWVPASAFSGSTASRPASSWATPARSAWAGRLPGLP